MDIVNNNKVKINFKPLYQAIHIHEVLGLEKSVRAHYAENRRLQANLVLTSVFTLTEADISGFENYLFDIIGFFIIEFNVVNTTDSFRSTADVESLWDSANEKLYDVIISSLSNCTNPDHFLKIKEKFYYFIQIMDAHNFATKKLIDLLITFFEQYCQLMKSKTADLIHDIVLADEGNPYTVSTLADMAEVLKIYHPPEEKGEKIKFPRVFNFSVSFLETCKLVHKFIRGFYQFSEGFYQKFGEMEDILKKSVEDLFGKHLISSIEEKMGMPNVHQSEVVRIILNFSHYEYISSQIDELIMEYKKKGRRIHQNVGGHSAAPYLSKFKECRVNNNFETRKKLKLEFLNY